MISVVQRRRRWTTEEKLSLVEEATRSGASVAGVADRHGVSRSLLFEWRRQIQEGTMPGVVRAETGTSPALVPVRLVEDPPRLPESSAPPRPETARKVSAVSIAKAE